MDLALNNLQRLISHKTQTTNQLSKIWNQVAMSISNNNNHYTMSASIAFLFYLFFSLSHNWGLYILLLP